MSDVSQKYMAIIRNIAPHAPLDLDSLIEVPHVPSVKIVPQNYGSVPPSAMLWTQPEDETSYIGIRITSSIQSLEQVAISLSAIAVERQVVPIFISWIGDCGLQRFGLRVEHVSGETEADRLSSEEQLKRLWKLAIVIDASDVSAL
jgi:hypothetical protein